MTPHFEDPMRGFQPPDPEDLRRFPPAGPECERIRGRLRDHADGAAADAAGGDRKALFAEVDEHVHHCRSCALALCRAEHEVLKLKRALTPRRVGGRSALAPREGFTGRVMARVLGEMTASLSPAEMPAAPRRRRRRPLSVAGAAVLVSAAAALVLLLTLAGRGEERPESGWTVAEARGAFSGGSPLQVGALLAAVALKVDEYGSLVLTSGDGGDRLSFEGGARARTEGDHLVLEDGSLTAEIAGGMGMGMVAAGADVELPRGRYHMDVLQVLRHDELLDPGPARSLRLEVAEGGPAAVHWEGRSVEVAAGQAMNGPPGQPPRIAAIPDHDRILTALSEGASTADEDPEPDTLWYGRVIDGVSGAPVEGATVTVLTEEGRQVVTTNREGMYRLLGLERRAERLSDTGGHGVLAVMPPRTEGSRDLAMVLPRPHELRLARRGGRQTLARTVSLQPAAPLTGTVRMPDYRPVPEAQVYACVVDELFGTLTPVSGGRTAVDGQGRFELRGLPVHLPPHSSLVLVVAAAGFETAVVPVGRGVPIGDRPLSLTAVMAELPSHTAVGLPAGSSVECAAVVEGLPRGLACLRWRGTVDAGGRLELPWTGTAMACSAGEGWERLVLDPSSGTVQTGDPVEGWPPAGRTERLGGGQWLTFRSGHRYGLPATTPGDWALSAQDHTGTARRGTDLFLRGGAGKVHFLGTYTGITALPVSLPGEGAELIAVAGDGALGELVIETSGPHGLVVPMQPPASLELPTAPGGVRIVRLEDVDGGRTLVRRTTAERGWRVEPLLPGRYRLHSEGLSSRQIVLEPGQRRVLGR